MILDRLAQSRKSSNLCFCLFLPREECRCIWPWLLYGPKLNIFYPISHWTVAKDSYNQREEESLEISSWKVPIFPDWRKWCFLCNTPDTLWRDSNRWHKLQFLIYQQQPFPFSGFWLSYSKVEEKRTLRSNLLLS